MKFHVLCWAAMLSLSASATAESLQIQPPFAHVRLRGPVGVAGWNPLDVEELIDGRYELYAGGIGLVQARGWITHNAAGLKHDRWAGPAALFHPSGLAHVRRGDKRGWTFFVSGISGGVAWAYQERDLRKTRDRLDDAKADLELATTPDEEKQAALDVSLNMRAVDDEERIRDIWIGYTAATWLMAGVEAWIFTPSVSFSRDADGNPRLRVPERGPLRTGLRSLIVPGAGQRSLGHDIRASYYTLGVFTGVLASIFAQEYYLEARRELAVAEEAFDLAETDAERDQARRDVRSAENRYDKKNFWRWAFIGTTAAIHAWNVFDAFRLGAEPTPSETAWRVVPTPNGVALHVAFGGP